MELKTNELNFDLKKTLNYEEIARRTVFGYDQLFIMSLSVLAVNHNEFANVLVVGCGSGMELTTFGNLMPNWHITGVDPSEEMIKLSKTKIDENNLNDRVLLHHGFLESLPEEEKFDFATLIFVLRFIPGLNDKIYLFNNISKRLKPGGRLIIIDQYGDRENEDFINMSKFWQNFMRFKGSSREMVEKIVLQAEKHSLINEQELQTILSDTGFEKLNRFYSSFIHGGWVIQKNV